jgi:hypothetical protein
LDVDLEGEKTQESKPDALSKNGKEVAIVSFWKPKNQLPAETNKTSSVSYGCHSSYELDDPVFLNLAANQNDETMHLRSAELFFRSKSKDATSLYFFTQTGGTLQLNRLKTELISFAKDQPTELPCFKIRECAGVLLGKLKKSLGIDKPKSDNFQPQPSWPDLYPTFLVVKDIPVDDSGEFELVCFNKDSDQPILTLSYKILLKFQICESSQNLQALSINSDHEIQRETFDFEGKSTGQAKKWKLPSEKMGDDLKRCLTDNKRPLVICPEEDIYGKETFKIAFLAEQKRGYVLF